MAKEIKSACQCGEPILIELGSEISFRADGKRPHYANDDKTTTLRCRKCRGWLADTCADAKHDVDFDMLKTETTLRNKYAKN